MKRAGHGGEQVRAEGVATDRAGHPGGRDEPLVSGPAEQQPGDEHADKEQRQDLLGEPPGGGEPVAAARPARW